MTNRYVNPNLINLKIMTHYKDIKKSLSSKVAAILKNAIIKNASSINLKNAPRLKGNALNGAPCR